MFFFLIQTMRKLEQKKKFKFLTLYIMAKHEEKRCMSYAPVLKTFMELSLLKKIVDETRHCITDCALKASFED